MKLKKIEKRISFFLKRITEYPLVQLNDLVIDRFESATSLRTYGAFS